MISEYQKSHLQAFSIAASVLDPLTGFSREKWCESIRPYLMFRMETKAFLDAHFSGICTEKCYESSLSACCSKEGIIAFFADVVVNVLVSEKRDIREIMKKLSLPHTGDKCVYLDGNGCMWKVKPVVCEMFLCDQAKEAVFGGNESRKALEREWESLENKRKEYTWPDKPVLFESLEQRFIASGRECDLMYFHKSPGLLRVKKLAGRP